MDKDTWSRSMVAMLGLDTIGASLSGGVKSTPMVPPQPPDSSSSRGDAHWFGNSNPLTIGRSPFMRGVAAERRLRRVKAAGCRECKSRTVKD
jgi:hypothetical protein